jgi:hypothetical protein
MASGRQAMISQLVNWHWLNGETVDNNAPRLKTAEMVQMKDESRPYFWQKQTNQQTKGR